VKNGGEEKSFIFHPSQVEGERWRGSLVHVRQECIHRYSYIHILTERTAGKYQRHTAENVYNLICACVFMFVYV